jgi:hypothetical protein
VQGQRSWLLKDRRGDQRGGEWEPIKIPHGIWHISQKSTQIHSTKPSNVIGLVKRNQDRERSVLALRSASHGTPLKNQDWGDLCGRTNINNRTHAVTRLGEASAFGWRARKKNRSDRVRSAAQGLGSQRSDTQKKTHDGMSPVLHETKIRTREAQNPGRYSALDCCALTSTKTRCDAAWPRAVRDTRNPAAWKPG